MMRVLVCDPRTHELLMQNKVVPAIIKQVRIACMHSGFLGLDNRALQSKIGSASHHEGGVVACIVQPCSTRQCHYAD